VLSRQSVGIRQAAHVLRAGGVVAYPTEAVYGLGCDPRRREAVERIRALKHRPEVKGLILIAAGYRQLRPFVSLPRGLESQVLASWPGPVTWVVPARLGVPVWLRGRGGGIAVRVTAHPVAAELCRRAGVALVSTSANVHGRPPARSAFAVRRTFASGVDFVLSGALGALQRPTEIRHARSGRLLRPA
jgi:L-threonylcarbamoyladenylate synthase